MLVSLLISLTHALHYSTDPYGIKSMVNPARDWFLPTAAEASGRCSQGRGCEERNYNNNNDNNYTA